MPRRRPSLPCTVRRLLHDLVTLVRLGLTSRAQLAAENLFLRKLLALYQERHTKPRRPDPATRVTVVLLSRLLDWRSMLTERRRLAVRGHRLGRRILSQVATIVTPDTILRWHRQLIARKWHALQLAGESSSRPGRRSEGRSHE